jgi:hypothetical protein
LPDVGVKLVICGGPESTVASVWVVTLTPESVYFTPTPAVPTGMPFTRPTVETVAIAVFVEDHSVPAVEGPNPAQAAGVSDTVLSSFS